MHLCGRPSVLFVVDVLRGIHRLDWLVSVFDSLLKIDPNFTMNKVLHLSFQVMDLILLHGVAGPEVDDFIFRCLIGAPPQIG